METYWSVVEIQLGCPCVAPVWRHEARRVVSFVQPHGHLSTRQFYSLSTYQQNVWKDVVQPHGHLSTRQFYSLSTYQQNVWKHVQPHSHLSTRQFYSLSTYEQNVWKHVWCPTNVDKHVTSNIACARCQQHIKIFSLLIVVHTNVITQVLRGLEQPETIPRHLQIWYNFNYQLNVK